MQKINIILLIVVVIFMILASGCVSNRLGYFKTDDEYSVNPQVCTADAKICPDGSAVGRIPPDCEFAPCPALEDCSSFSTDNCPDRCVICPPCEACSSITCRSEEFCNSIGFNRSWWMDVNPYEETSNKTEEKTEEPKEPENNITNTPSRFNYYNITPKNEELDRFLKSNIYYKTTFLFKFPIVKSPMEYYVYKKGEIREDWYNITVSQIPKAFDEWAKASKGKINFTEVRSKPENGIIIEIVDDLPGSTIAYSSPNYIELDNYTLITGGEIIMEANFSPYQTRLTLMHEIGHILGFGHTESENDIMYTYYDKYEYYGHILDYNKKVLEILYSVVP
jgi:hypothetical protein